MPSKLISPRWLAMIALATIALAAAGCGGGSDGPTCGSGTTLEAGECVVASTVTGCGPGTVRDGAACVPLDADASTAAEVAEADTGGPDGQGADTTGPPPEDTAVGVACSPTCGDGTVCVDGLCERLPAPDAWICAPAGYRDGASCDCGCGAPDPDCADSALPVVGCSGGGCQADGACAPCVPECAGKTCGDDGCGGQCGYCIDPAAPVCVAGACQACTPACDGKECGDDGCGGQCGTCVVGMACTYGTCSVPAADASCALHCGGVAPSGCSCTAYCESEGDCCADVIFCGCLPQCAGKSCGDDGCGGSCGACTAGEVCDDGVCALATCAPGKCSGHGTCDDTTPTCACDVGFDGPACAACAVGFVGYPTCAAACEGDAGCEDNNDCTVDVCTQEAGCLHVALSVPCSDADACTTADVCSDGHCVSGPATVCDDLNACTTDSCDPATGCVHTASGVSACDDGDACTTGDACSGVTCAGTPASCVDGNECTDDACSPATGCLHVPNAAPCTSPDACLLWAVCDQGACTAVAVVDCDDGVACTVDACDAATAECSHVPAPAGAACDDDDLCTAGETCDASGACGAGARICALGTTSGLAAHYSAGVSATITKGPVGSVLAWNDLSGHGRDLVQGDPQNTAHVVTHAVHGRPGVRLTGSAGLVTADFALGMESTVLAVVCADGPGPLGAVASHGGASGGWSLDEPSAAAVGLAAAGVQAASASPTEAGHCYVLVGRLTAGGTDLALIERTTAVASGPGVVLATSASPLRVGGVDPGVGTGVVLAELLVYDRALTDAERDAVAAYLRAAWGFDPPAPDVAWYDAADAATLVTDTAGLLSEWKDKSGHGRHATAGTDEPPIWYESGTSNGRPAVRFDGAKVRLKTGVVDASAHMTLFAVFEMDQPEAFGTVIAQGQDAHFALRRSQCASCTSDIEWQIANADDAARLSQAPGAWMIVTAMQDASMSTLYAVPGVASESIPQSPIPPGSASLTLGNSAAGAESMGGFLAEVRAYGAALSATDRAYVEALLRVKYGL